MKIISIARLLSAALVVFSATAWGGWIDDLKNTSTYDSSTGVYTLTGDFSVNIINQDVKVDLNGHSFAFSGLSSNLELLNSSSTRAQVTINGNGLGSADKTLVIGSGVDLLKNSYNVFVDGTMKLCEGSRCYFEGTACVDKHDDDASGYFQVIFEETANVIVEPGAMLKQYVDPYEAEDLTYYYAWYNKEGFVDLCVQEGCVPEGCNLQGPDADGYYLLVVDAKYSSFNDLVAEYSDYNSSTDTYVLREDLNCFDGSLPDIDGCDISSVSESLKIDLNGHSVITEYINIGEQTLELKNSSSAQGYMSGFYDLAESGQLIIGNNVKFEDNCMEACRGLDFSPCHDNTWYGTIAVRNGGFFKNGQPFMKTNYGGQTQFNGLSLSFQVEVGAKFVSSSDSAALKGMLDYGLWHLPADCKVVSLGNTEYDYGTTFLVKLSRELVSTDDCEFTIDTRTERTAVAGSTESFTIPDEVWEAAGGNPVTVTYTKDGGAAQTLGTYKQGDKVEWIPTAGGNYTFTFGSSEYQASFHVDKTPGIFITSAKQRWPWNGMVDIGYFVEGLDPEKEYTATFHVTCKGETKSFTLAGIVNGDATTAWDAAAATAWGKTLVKEPATVRADLRCLTVKEPEKWGTYMIVDLTKLGQAGCVTYETKESAEAACNAYNRDEYKTTKLVLRKVAKGQAYPVKPGATANLTDADVMTPQKDYYIGVFMVTKAQYDYVMGVSTTSTDKNPTPYLTYNEIRKNDIDTGNAMSPLNPVCNNSFMHRLVQGCLDADGNAVGRFDLPTEIQWEIACRAGSFAERGSYLDASFQEITLTQALIKNVVCGSALKAVGTYRPNAWGLYDMLGNLWQWCLDESIAYTDYTHVDVETPYFSGLSPKRMLRGYYYNTMAVSIRPGGQNAAQDAYANQYWNGGIRVCHVED